MKKIIGIPFLLIFINLGFILFESEVFKNPIRIIPILILNIFISIDILIRGIVEMSHEDIDNALTELQQKGLVNYRIVDDRWELKT